MLVWHYTTGSNFVPSVQGGSLRHQGDAGVGQSPEELRDTMVNPPLVAILHGVWFTQSDVFAVTAPPRLGGMDRRTGETRLIPLS
jgi:hypothetical protein